jgi:hypothetical protein
MTMTTFLPTSYAMAAWKITVYCTILINRCYRSLTVIVTEIGLHKQVDEHQLWMLQGLLHCLKSTGYAIDNWFLATFAVDPDSTSILAVHKDHGCYI